MSYAREFYQLLMKGSEAHARWELEMSTNILKSRRRKGLLLLLLLPILLGGIAIAAGDGSGLPNVLGGKTAYMPSHYTNAYFLCLDFCRGLCRSYHRLYRCRRWFHYRPGPDERGGKGILAVGTDLFHIFAKAIMGSVLHRKLGNISCPWPSPS